MNIIVKMQFGSHLYGTQTPKSDIDIKGIYIPDAEDILLQKVKGVIVNKTNTKNNTRNSKLDSDEEYYSLQKYLELLSEGQTVAIDMLFCPENQLIETSAIWTDIVNNRNKLLTKKSTSFIGYCRKQANKYGIKGSRVSTARQALEIFSSVNESKMNASNFEIAFEKMFQNNPHAEVVNIKQSNGTYLKHYEICNKLIPLTVTQKYACEIIQKIVDGYGSRALQAEANEGLDWKALSHAVRIGHQALELLNFHKVTFPLKNAKHILDIKLGKVDYQSVAKEIESLLEQIEVESLKSTIQDQPNYQWIKNFIKNQYKNAILNS